MMCLRNEKLFVFFFFFYPPSLSTMLKCSGRFIFVPMANRVPFHKTYTNSHDLVNLLQSRGLAVADPTNAERYLEYIGYFKFFLDVISPPNDMSDKLLRLLSDYPSIDLNAMGFPKGWQQEPLWK